MATTTTSKNKKTTSKKTKTKTTAKNAATSNTTARTSSSKTTTPLREREPKVIVVDAAYAIAGLATDAMQFAGEAVDAARHLPQRVRGTSTTRSDLEKRLHELRDRAENRFDAKSAAGRSVTDDLLKNQQVKRVLDQAKTAQSQMKGAVTSLRRTATRSVDAGLTAGRSQARNASSQVKAARTSVQKTAEVTADAVARTANGNN